MANKSSFALFLALSVVSASALTVQFHNYFGSPADLGSVTVPVGDSRLNWSEDWGGLSLTWGTNTASLGTNGWFEVSVLETGLVAKEWENPAVVFGYGAGFAIVQGGLTWLALALMRRASPGRAATPEL